MTERDETRPVHDESMEPDARDATETREARDVRRERAWPPYGLRRGWHPYRPSADDGPRAA